MEEQKSGGTSHTLDSLSMSQSQPKSESRLEIQGIIKQIIHSFWVLLPSSQDLSLQLQSSLSWLEKSLL
ncbi:hypothetical protein Patl1_00339 [Pistacia atlantica]|uniref:Uncharacterized protein n=1 Tax=Pistacia atlantica TaxID=434234 RepID=A0ACC1CDF3_9ROSI|nr:hypothetical protein Patl1_00339 [Pistacia atlantica]